MNKKTERLAEQAIVFDGYKRATEIYNNFESEDGKKRAPTVDELHDSFEWISGEVAIAEPFEEYLDYPVDTIVEITEEYRYQYGFEKVRDLLHEGLDKLIAEKYQE